MNKRCADYRFFQAHVFQQERLYPPYQTLRHVMKTFRTRVLLRQYSRHLLLLSSHRSRHAQRFAARGFCRGGL